MSNLLHKEVVGLFTGVTFEIRRIDLFDYMRELNDLPFLVAPSILKELDSLGEQLKTLPKEQQDTTNDKTKRFFLSHGIVRLKYPEADWQKPNIWYGDEDACPDGMVGLADLGTDAMLLVQQIMEFSFKIGAMPALAGFFRERGGDANAGPNSDEIPSEAIGATANGNNTGDS